MFNQQPQPAPDAGSLLSAFGINPGGNAAPEMGAPPEMGMPESPMGGTPFMPPTPPAEPAPAPEIPLAAPTFGQTQELNDELGVNAAQTEDYSIKMGLDRQTAAIHAKVDMLWEKIARKHGVLDGESDDLLWAQHQAFVQGQEERDPLHDVPEALEEFEEEVLKLSRQLAKRRL